MKRVSPRDAGASGFGLWLAANVALAVAFGGARAALAQYDPDGGDEAPVDTQGEEAVKTFSLIVRIDDEAGKAVEGATVRVRNGESRSQFTTGDAGEVRFDGLAEGSTVIAVFAPGMSGLRQTIDFRAADGRVQRRQFALASDGPGPASDDAENVRGRNRDRADRDDGSDTEDGDERRNGRGRPR